MRVSRIFPPTGLTGIFHHPRHCIWKIIVSKPPNDAPDNVHFFTAIYRINAYRSAYYAIGIVFITKRDARTLISCLFIVLPICMQPKRARLGGNYNQTNQPAKFDRPGRQRGGQFHV